LVLWSDIFSVVGFDSKEICMLRVKLFQNKRVNNSFRTPNVSGLDYLTSIYRNIWEFLLFNEDFLCESLALKNWNNRISLELDCNYLRTTSSRKKSSTEALKTCSLNYKQIAQVCVHDFFNESARFMGLLSLERVLHHLRRNFVSLGYPTSMKRIDKTINRKCW
jgi:hypothetical protein